MKTVLFIEHTKTLFEQVGPGHGYNQLDVREYVLASEAYKALMDHNERIKVLEDALKTAIGAGEYVVRLCENDAKCGASPNPLVRSMPSAIVAECYAAMNFLYEARAALEVKP
jgi:phage baseplate assembly protein W